MPKYVIERDIREPTQVGRGSQRSAAKSCAVLDELGKNQWYRYVTDEKLYCVYTAPIEALIEQHAKRAASRQRIYEVRDH